MATPADDLVRELQELHRRLRETVAGLPVDLLDRAPTGGANSIAVLATHALGSELGWLHLAAGRHHERDRASEFAVRGRGTADLLRSVEDTDRAAAGLVAAAFEAGLGAERERPGARPVTVAFCLTRAIAHLAEHVGHAELTRQMLIAAAPAKT